MAKAPRPGSVKTRLCPPLRAEEAAALYRCFLLDKIESVRTLTGSHPVIAYAPDDAGADFEALAPGISRLAQHGPDLGARLHNTLATLLSAGHLAAVAVDSDTPTLPHAFLQEAIDTLSGPGPDLVLGPTEDGGYYLIGVRAARPELFAGVPWSTATVFDETLRRAHAASLRVARLPAWFDIDTPDDLHRLRTALAAAAVDGVAPWTRRFLAECLL